MRKAMSKDCNGKIFSELLLYTKSSSNKKKYTRDWLICSSSKKTLHFFPCLLFSKNLTESIKSRREVDFLQKQYPGKSYIVDFHSMKIVKRIVLVIVNGKMSYSLCLVLE